LEIPCLTEDRKEAGYLLFSQVFETNVCGHRYNSEIRSYVPRSGVRSPPSISRYSRTLIPTSQAARQTRRPSRFRERRIIPGYAAKVGMFKSLPARRDTGYACRVIWLVLLAAVVFYLIGRRAGAVGRLFEQRWRREDERFIDDLRQGTKPS
jgi:hypothetical protein